MSAYNTSTTSAGTTGTTATGAPLNDATATAGTTSTGNATNKGASLGAKVKEGATSLHGIGEAVRGNINQAISGALNDKEGATKSAAVTEKGLHEMDTGRYQGHPEAENRF